MFTPPLCLVMAWGLLLGTGPLLKAESPAPAEPAPTAVPMTPGVELASPDSVEPEEETPPVAVPPEIVSAVEELQSEEFVVRQRAVRRLVEMGASAFEPLIVLLHQVSGETSERILLVLEQIWLQTPLPLADELEQKLEEISLSFSPHQAAVKRILHSHFRLREERATHALRRLNAVIQQDMDVNDRELRAKLDVDLSQPKQRITNVILPRSWKGTPADLWHIRRLSHTPMMGVFYVRGINLSDADKLSMRLGFPGLDINERSEIFIGVVGSSVAFDNLPGCQITGIQADSPAHIAGLQINDRILTVDGEEIHGFENLVEVLKSKHAYQPIEVLVERSVGQDPMLITVIGLPWEVRSFPSPPPPPQAESLLNPPTFRRGRLQIYRN